MSHPLQDLSSCCLSYKDTILKANHSPYPYPDTGCHAVAYPTKILFWKRITALLLLLHRPLLLILQRYYFESESQHGAVRLSRYFGCCLSYKDTILKANHSRIWLEQYNVRAVAYPTKILFWKRITALFSRYKKLDGLLLILQRYYFESESQHCMRMDVMRLSCCLSYKDTILKANHS